MHKMLLPVIRLDISSDNVRTAQRAATRHLAWHQGANPASRRWKIRIVSQAQTAGQAWLAARADGWLAELA